jgi:nucleoside-diphosphate-sugar epimerase
LCTEKTPINPLTLYGRNKAEGEIIVRDCGGISLRLATLFGVAGKCRNDLLINNLMRDAIKNRCITLFQGNVMRTFLEVSEAARCFRIAIDGGLDSGETYNVGDENYNFTKLQVAEKICKLTNAHLFTNDYNSDPDGRDYQVSYEKIKIKGFSSVLSINDVLSNLKSYYEVN